MFPSDPNTLLRINYTSGHGLLFSQKYWFELEIKCWIEVLKILLDVGYNDQHSYQIRARKSIYLSVIIGNSTIYLPICNNLNIYQFGNPLNQTTLYKLLPLFHDELSSLTKPFPQIPHSILLALRHLEILIHIQLNLTLLWFMGVGHKKPSRR